jgi:hypothetical protein
MCVISTTASPGLLAVAPLVHHSSFPRYCLPLPNPVPYICEGIYPPLVSSGRVGGWGSLHGIDGLHWLLLVVCK